MHHVYAASVYHFLCTEFNAGFFAKHQEMLLVLSVAISLTLLPIVLHLSFGKFLHETLCTIW